jgi:hypothetical protein
MSAYSTHIKMGTHFVTLYGAQEVLIGTFAGSRVIWATTQSPEGSFGTRDQPASWEGA